MAVSKGVASSVSVRVSISSLREGWTSDLGVGLGSVIITVVVGRDEVKDVLLAVAVTDELKIEGFTVGEAV